MEQPNAIARRMVKPAAFVISAIFLQLSLTSLASATENGASTYPVGVDTRMSGMQPSKGQTVLYNYTNFYWANETDNGNGKSTTPGFKIRIAADAPKIVHDWGINFLGGTLHSNITFPTVHEELNTGSAKGNETGLGNMSMALLGVTYVHKNIHWYYEGDFNLPGGSYNSNNIANIGQHNFAGGPVGAITYLPHEGRQDLSAKVSYLFNSKNGANNYASGNEFMTEYAASQRLGKYANLGVNGYYFQQTTDDKQNGVAYEGGYRGRDFTIGPVLDFKLDAVSGMFKYERDTLVENRTRGNVLWFEFMVPLTHRHDKKI